MTKEEANQILDRYKGWNEDRVSSDLAFGGVRTQADDIFDERRKLILQATKALQT